SVNVLAVNDAPTLTATANSGIYTEDGAATSLFSSAAINTIEAGQTITSLTFTVGNVANGTSELINIDGSAIQLVAGTGTTTTNGMSYTVTVSGGTATVVLTKVAGISSANAQTLVNNMSYENTSQDPTAGSRTITLTQIKDNGGTANSGVDTSGLALAASVNVLAVNDAPTLTATANSGTYTEDGAATSLFSSAAINTIEAGQTITSLTFTVGNVTNGTSEIINIDGSAIQLVAGTGTTTTNGMSYTVTVSGGTATVVLTKVAGISSANAQTLVNNMSYENTSQDPTAGSRTITLTQIKDNGGTANSGVDTSGLALAASVNVLAVNDAPTLTATANSGIYTEDGAATSLFSSAAINTIEAGQTITSLTFTVGNVANGTSEIINIDGSAIQLVAGSGTTTTNGMSYTVTVSGGTATVVLTKVAGISSANAQTLVNNMSYENTSQDPTAGSRTITLTQIKDNGGTANSGVDTSGLALAASVNVLAVNDAPTLTATANSGTYTEDGAATSLFSSAAINTIEAGQTITSLTFTVGNVVNGNAEIINIDGSAIQLVAGSGTTSTNGMSYTVTVSGGTATVVLTKVAGISSANAQTLVNGMSYENTSQDPTAGSRTITLTQIKDNGGTANSGVDISGLALAASVNVLAVNDAPTLTATANSGTYTEDGAATSLFSSAAINTIEAGQTITSLTFTVGNVVNGNAEIINIDGSAIQLVAGSGTTSTNGMSYTVTVSGGTATVVLTKAAGITTSNAQSVINNMSYENTSQDPTAGSRTITLTQIKDNGGTANSGVDISGLALAASVNVLAVNDAPTLTATANSGTYTEDGAATSLFSSAAINTIEAGQTITSLTFTVGNVANGTSELINIDGSAIQLVAGTGTTSTNGMSYTVT